VFEAKFKEPNPRLPFYIVLGVLSVLAIGTVIYFWIQLRPAPALVNANPPRATDEKPVDVAAAKPAAAGAPAPAAPGTADLPGLPGAAALAPPAAPTAQAPAAAAAPSTPVAAAPAASTPPPTAPLTAKPVPRAAPRKPAAESAPGTRSLSINRGGPRIHPRVAAGYAAYQSGDLAAARAEYEQALREDGANRDALLGLAAIEMRAQRYDLADGYYQRLLRADPRDPYAQAGMLALRSQQLDPVLAESRVKSLLAADQNANVLYFTLGNQYAQQGRWAEAQQAYFKAFTADPDNPDFAFNLAVSFDQIRQPRLALEYYRRALALAEKRPASFAADAARARVQQLAR
jgi:tetratricopeptide (TPR) repeat protein